MSEIKFAYEGEARLLRWADSGGAGRTITIQLDENGDVHPFKHLNWGAEHGQRMKIACVLIDDHEQPITPEHAGRRRKKAPRGAVPEKSVEPAKVVKVEGDGSRSRTQAAGWMVKREDFQIWLGETYPEIWDRYYIDGGALSPEAANLTLKEILGIHSKKELDTSASKAIAWDALLCDFDVRNTVRA